MFFSVISLFSLKAQQQGFSYQAIIIDQNPEQIPGKNISGNVLPNHQLIMRFTILDSIGSIEYQEEHSTQTDKYGMINLIVGWGTPTSASPGLFSDIDWNGKNKTLKVSISLSQTDVFFTDFSIQVLTFVPYAYHRNITATGSMTVEGVSTLKNRLNVTNGSSTFLSGTLTVDKNTNLKSQLNVDSNSFLNGQVVINSKNTADKNIMSSYPLVVKGSNQGIAVKIEGNRNNDNYFVSFWDDEKLQGRIEGETIDELNNNPEYIFDLVVYGNDIFQSTVDVVQAAADIVAASTSSTVCVGIGACVTSPVPSLIAVAIVKAVFAAADLAMQIAQLVIYNQDRRDNIGISFQSGSSDYAEWLPKLNENEIFTAGDIVGVKNGFISKNTENIDFVMVITRQAIVLGNMPQPGNEKFFDKVSFIGQVPVKVFGKVNPGDYIIPNGSNNGIGIAISPQNITIEQLKQVVGVAWGTNNENSYGMVNVAVGLKSNEVCEILSQQQTKIENLQNQVNDLQNQINQINTTLALLLPEYAQKMNIQPVQSTTNIKSQINLIDDRQLNEENVLRIYVHQITYKEIEEGIKQAQDLAQERGLDIKTNPFFVQINTDENYKNTFITTLQNQIEKEFQKTYGNELKKGAIIINY